MSYDMYLNNLLDAYHERFCIIDMICENCDAEYKTFDEAMTLCKDCGGYTKEEYIEDEAEDFDYDPSNDYNDDIWWMM